jgi:hypothetical protein
MPMQQQQQQQAAATYVIEQQKSYTYTDYTDYTVVYLGTRRTYYSCTT